MLAVGTGCNCVFGAQDDALFANHLYCFVAGTVVCDSFSFARKRGTARGGETQSLMNIFTRKHHMRHLCHVSAIAVFQLQV